MANTKKSNESCCFYSTDLGREKKKKVKMEEARSSVCDCLLEGIRKMYKTQRFTDVIIHVEDQSFRCHRVVLSSVSSYFDVMFSSGMMESNSMSTTIHNVSSQTFDEVLQYIYFGKDIIEPDNVGELLQVSAMLQIAHLQFECEEFILGNVDVNNCLGVWKLGISHNIESLTESSQPFLLSKFDEISQSDDFLKLEKDELDLILRDERLISSGEEIVCKALFRWIEADETRRKVALPDLFENIRLTSVSLEYLLDHLDQHPYILEHESCHKEVKNAIKYHALPSRRQELMWDEKPYRYNAEQEMVLAVVGKRLASDGLIVTEFMGYSFSNKRWVALQPIHTPLGDEFAVCSYGNDIFITGGTSNMTSCLRYSAKFSQWWKRSPMCCGRYRHSMVAVRDSLYVLGGYNFGTLSSIERYDMETEKWESVGELNYGVDKCSAAVMDKKVFILGSCSSFAAKTAGIQCFDTRTGTCTLIANLPTSPKFTNAVKFDDTVHVVCDNGDIISFSGKEEHHTLRKIKGFSKRDFGLFMDHGSLCIVGGNLNVLSEMEELCCDVIKVEGEEQHICEHLELPFPMTVTICLRIVVERKYPLLDIHSLIRDFGNIE
ncbi:kelch-like protein 24 [Ostrea edulis]|uniref:kelch-like protein 24 n=1 Tax=Ostrea edulis TaxID=37623 RepID=UPI0024AF6E48|nr:kelch-like protein 24 [Ostrea edulis]